MLAATVGWGSAWVLDPVQCAALIAQHRLMLQLARAAPGVTPFQRLNAWLNAAASE